MLRYPTESYIPPTYDAEEAAYHTKEGEKIGSDTFDPSIRSALKCTAMQFIEVNTEADQPRFHTHEFRSEIEKCGVKLEHFEAVDIMEEALQLAEMIVNDKYGIRTYVADEYRED